VNERRERERKRGERSMERRERERERGAIYLSLNRIKRKVLLRARAIRQRGEKRREAERRASLLQRSPLQDAGASRAMSSCIIHGRSAANARQVERPEVRTRKVALSRGPRGDWRSANRERLQVSLATSPQREDATSTKGADLLSLEPRDCSASLSLSRDE